MKNITAAFFESWKILKNDRIILFLSAIPVVIGILIYFFLGRWLYVDILSSGRGWIETRLVGGGWGIFLYYLFATLLTIMLFLLINWTFALIVSLVASPFNDLLSSRVEKIILGTSLPDAGLLLKTLISDFVKTVVNEMKKILFIALLGLFGFFLSFVPFLVPLSMLISAMLLAVTFLDYSWSRRNYNFKSCFKDVADAWGAYTFSGAVFLILISLPFINIVVFPFGVIYFTVFFVKKNALKEMDF